MPSKTGAHSLSQYPAFRHPVMGMSFLPPAQEVLKKFWGQGLSGKRLLMAHSQLLDQWIEDLFTKLPPKVQEKVVIVALGGYGREELFPYSDIDLMILYDPSKRNCLDPVCDAILYPLWDANREVGHGVRTIEDCLKEAERDFFLLVSFLDARYICGDKNLFQDFQDTIKLNFIEGKRREIVEAFIDHRSERCRRFGDHAYLLEPNIKDGRGGLRDLHTLIWISKVLFGIQDMADLKKEGIIFQDEYQRLSMALEQLIRVRNRLHFVSNKRNDRLFFEYQVEIARLLDFSDQHHMLGVEKFMKEVHHALSTISSMTDLFLEHVYEVLNPRAHSPSALVLEPGVEIVNNRIMIDSKKRIGEDPELIMRLFHYSSTRDIPLHYRTKRIIREATGLIQDAFRQSKAVRDLFLGAIMAAKDPKRLLFVMHHETDLLCNYIPEFSKIKALSQYDIYHVNTVDIHLIETVNELARLRQTESAVFMPLETTHILYWAALLHDIGKGFGVEHSKKGGEIAREIGIRVGLNPKEIDLLCFLIENHLYLADTAQKRDLEDESLILKCARHIKDPERLRMLYLLTIADSKATGPSAWSDWKGALITELYLRISHLLEQGQLIDPDRHQGIHWLKNKVKERLHGTDQEILDNLPEDYLLSFTPEAIQDHLSLKKRIGIDKVIVIPEDKGAYWSVLIITQDRTGLMSRICGVLTLENLRVLAAQMFTLKDGTVVDVLDVEHMFKVHFEEMAWDRLKEMMKKAISGKLSLPHRLKRKFMDLSQKKLPVCLVEGRSDIRIDNEASDFYTVIDIESKPRVGLLYSVTRTMADLGVNISRAKLGPSGDRIYSSFYCLDESGEKITDADLCTELKDALIFATECAF